MESDGMADQDETVPRMWVEHTDAGYAPRFISYRRYLDLLTDVYQGGTLTKNFRVYSERDIATRGKQIMPHFESAASFIVLFESRIPRVYRESSAENSEWRKPRGRKLLPNWGLFVRMFPASACWPGKAKRGIVCAACDGRVSVALAPWRASSHGRGCLASPQPCLRAGMLFLLVMLLRRMRSHVALRRARVLPESGSGVAFDRGEPLASAPGCLPFSHMFGFASC